MKAVHLRDRPLREMAPGARRRSPLVALIRFLVDYQVHYWEKVMATGGGTLTSMSKPGNSIKLPTERA